MKQNERLLVYAVTGFLALILVIAVMFGNDPVDASKKQENTSKGLNDILQPKLSDAEKAEKAAADAKAKALADKLIGNPNGESTEQPLNARVMNASAIVARELGPSRRERMVRWVDVKQNDAFEKLVRRWCGEPEEYLAEALSLNEETVTLRVGSKVMVPWVDDEVLAAMIEAKAPRLLAGNPVGSDPSRTLMNSSRGTVEAGMPRPSRSRTGPIVPGRGPVTPASGGPAPSGGRAATTGDVLTYKVKSGDNLWDISAKQYGRGKADKMIKVILAMNSGLTTNLKVNQEFKMPKKAE